MEGNRPGFGTTYRIQLRPGFGFEPAAAVLPYLADLGVESVYLSPVLEARRGSQHGYDVTDATALRVELGGERGFRRLVRAAREKGLGVMLDVVPNHMAADGQNPWWRDVLEHGRHSHYAEWFDIDWEGGPGRSNGRLLLPVLGDDLRSILARGELRLGVDDAGLHLRYWDARFPLAVGSYGIVLAEAVEEIRRRHGPRAAAARDLSRVLREVQGVRPSETPRVRRATAAVKRDLRRYRADHGEVEWTLRRAFVRIVRGAALEKRERLFERILARQHYRLVFWKRGPGEINFRRFFNVADLVALRVERPDVFEARHALLFRLLGEGAVDAVRIDHVDGLRDPEGYLKRLRRRVGRSRRLVVEKILTAREALPSSWPVEGTTGYDYLAASGALAVDPAGLDALWAGWKGFTGNDDDFEEVCRRAKRDVAGMHFSGEVRAMARGLSALASRGPGGADVTPEEAEEVLLATLAAFPVYRTYVRGGALHPEDRRTVERALREGRRRAVPAPAAAWRALRRVLLLEIPPGAVRREASRFVERWQLLTAPVHAKGVEDTAFYRCVPLGALNEVGAEPSVPRDPVAAFHRSMRSRLEHHPRAMNATTTHDTKRGEDIRARLSALTELPEAWWTLVRRWHRLNHDLRAKVRGRAVPSPAEEALFYQTLVGTWPAEGALSAGFRRRMRDYAWKASREAKEATSWLHPDRDHEEALASFVMRALRTSGNNPFLNDVDTFRQGLARVGAWNGLSQVVLKVAAPGVPDLYQGSEAWDLRLVDPDNRGEVDFGRRKRLLVELDRRARKGRAGLVRELVTRWADGRIKTYVLRESLRLRRREPELFGRGEYLPLRATAKRERHVVAFARKLGDRWAVAVTPRLVAAWCVAGGPPVGARVWDDALLLLPRGGPARLRNVFTDETVETRRHGRGLAVPLAALLSTSPVSLLVEDGS